MVDVYGSIFGVNVDIVRAGQKAAIMTEKILKRTAAENIPVISAESFLKLIIKQPKDLD